MDTRFPGDLAFGLGGSQVRGSSHVCGLFEGADDLYRQLTPFIVEGMERGERAVHIVGPEGVHKHADRLGAAGMAVETLTSRGQLVIRDWTDFYLVDGHFEVGRTIGLVKAVLDEGRSLGFPRTRAIGLMEWALEHIDGVDAIAMYEAQLNLLLRSSQDVVICAYEARRHKPSVVVDVLSIHPFALVDGRLRKRSVRHDPRDRILATAARLFHKHGILATGIDRVIAEAGVAKVTFYRQFRSKEDLVVAWLDEPATRWFNPIMDRAERGAGTWKTLVARIFDGTAEWLEHDGYRGCPYLNTIAELADTASDHRVRALASGCVEEFRDRLRRAATAVGREFGVGDQLHALITGAIGLAVASRSTAPVHMAGAAAAAL